MSLYSINKLNGTLDVPIALPATKLQMGDWLALAVLRLAAPMLITYRLASLQLFSSSATLSSISEGNKIYGNLGLAYLVMRRDYVSGSPGAAGGLDVLTATSIGVF